ncbi:MAG: methylated-DNA--[protein]-cysteine S-methyltransferase [Kofleriaceae bacterium]
MLRIDRLDSPVGELAIVVDADGGLRALGWRGPWPEAVACADPGGVTTALRRYFAGELAALDALPVVFEGSEFQCRVWNALRELRPGETCSYGHIARRIGQPTAVRAVGLANGANPVAIVVPCHRVIGANGTLTGYGGGLERKRWLLDHERRDLFRR